MKIYNDEAIVPTRIQLLRLPFSAKHPFNAFSCDCRLSHTVLPSDRRVMMVNKY